MGEVSGGLQRRLSTENRSVATSANDQTGLIAGRSERYDVSCYGGLWLASKISAEKIATFTAG